MNKLFHNFGLATGHYSKAISFIFKNKLAWFFLFPLAFNIILWIIGFNLVGDLTDFAIKWTEEQSGSGTWNFWGAEYLQMGMSGLIWIILKILFFIVFGYFGGFIILVVMSPVLAILSEKTEKILTGKEYEVNAEQIMRDVVRGILIALRNASIEFGLLLIITPLSFILSFIPVIGWLLVIACQAFMFFISSYFYGFSYMDYMNERRKLNVYKSIGYMRRNKGAVMGNGSIFTVSTMIPFCGTTIAPFFSIVSVVAGSITYLELDKENGGLVKA